LIKEGRQMNTQNPPICTIVLAAGQSKRMGCCKQVLPWGKETIITHIISIIKQSTSGEIIVVTGGYRDKVEAAVSKSGVRVIFNPDYDNDDMVLSLQIGLRAAIQAKCGGCLVALGDQPNIVAVDLRKMVGRYADRSNKIIMPSFEMRRGHPWLIPCKFFNELMELQPPQTMRDFLMKHEQDIEYVLSENPDILCDIDTPEDYERLRPKE
jgi:molybdenum cofactor cytidylyltransferase